MNAFCLLVRMPIDRSTIFFPRSIQVVHFSDLLISAKPMRLMSFKGKPDRCPVDVRARIMTWPPVEREPTGRASKAFDHQSACATFLDSRLSRLFDGFPGDTIVVLTADHGDCFGEDGYWGHGVNHPKVLEVPMAIFRLDRQPLPQLEAMTQERPQLQAIDYLKGKLDD